MKAKLSHEFCLEIICDFFNLENPKYLGQVIANDLGDITKYEHEDLDTIWIDGRIRKHLDEVAPADTELKNQEQIEQ